MGIQTLEKLFSLQTNEISFVTKHGGFGGKLLSTKKKSRVNCIYYFEGNSTNSLGAPLLISEIKPAGK